MATGLLKIASVPTANLVRLKRRLAGFTRLVARELDHTVRLRVPASYEAVLDGMLVDDWHVVSTGPELWLSAIDRGAHYRPLVRPIRNGNDSYRAAIFVRRDAGIHRLDQLRRNRVAFVSRNSAAGFVVPRAALSRAGVSLQSLQSHTFVGSHENVLALVAAGRTEAGCTFLGAEKTLGRGDGALARELEPLWVSEPIPNEVYSMSEAFIERKPDMFEKLRGLMASMHESEEGRQALADMQDQVERFDVVDADVYERAREMLRRT